MAFRRRVFIMIAALLAFGTSEAKAQSGVPEIYQTPSLTEHVLAKFHAGLSPKPLPAAWREIVIPGLVVAHQEPGLHRLWTNTWFLFRASRVSVHSVQIQRVTNGSASLTGTVVADMEVPFTDGTCTKFRRTTVWAWAPSFPPTLPRPGWWFVGFWEDPVYGYRRC